DRHVEALRLVGRRALAQLLIAQPRVFFPGPWGSLWHPCLLSCAAWLPSRSLRFDVLLSRACRPGSAPGLDALQRVAEAALLAAEVPGVVDGPTAVVDGDGR